MNRVRFRPKRLRDNSFYVASILELATASGADRSLNLHAAWDDALFAYARAAPAWRTQIGELMRANRQRWSEGDPLAWALQSNAIARDFIYARWPEPLVCGQAPQASVLIDRAYADAAAARGVKVQVFGASADNARAFWNWQFLGPQPDLPLTRAMLMRACDVRLPARLTPAECAVIADILIAAADDAMTERRAYGT